MVSEVNMGGVEKRWNEKRYLGKGSLMVEVRMAHTEREWSRRFIVLFLSDHLRKEFGWDFSVSEEFTREAPYQGRVWDRMSSSLLWHMLQIHFSLTTYSCSSFYLTSTYPSIHPSIHPFIHPSIHSFTHLPTHSFTHPSIHTPLHPSI